MRKSTIIILLVFLAGSFGGCKGVSESDHQTVVSERDDLKSELTSIQEEAASLEKECRALERENDSLRSELAQQKREIARLMDTTSKQVEGRKTERVYKVESGDSLWTISRRFRVSVTALQELNNLKDSNIKPGQKLVLP